VKRLPLGAIGNIMNREEMIKVMREIAERLSLSTIPRNQYIRETGLSERQILKTFGSYNALVEAAGLKPTLFPTSDTPLYSDEELLKEIVRVLRIPESKLTRIYFEQNASISPSVCERRFGGWINALKKATELLSPDVESNLITRIVDYTAPSFPNSQQVQNRRERLQNDISNDDTIPIEGQAIVNFPTDSINVYGDFINFRGLQHAPVNEQGVVFLFGMICRELGYVVEIVRSGFPDCEAKRQIPGPKGKWQRVRIEFEFESRSFRSHGHDPDQCDVIVCWEHNWPECPIEVLELRSSMKRLSSNT
jgi:hypothetical protein